MKLFIRYEDFGYHKCAGVPKYNTISIHKYEYYLSDIKIKW